MRLFQQRRQIIVIGLFLSLLTVLLRPNLLYTSASPLPDGGGTSGTPIQGVKPIVETTGQIMDRQRRSPQTVSAPRAMFPEEVDNPRPSNPASLNLRAGPATGPKTVQKLQAAQTVGITGDGPNYDGYFPPDTMGAVGPTQFVVTINGRIVSYNKTTGAADGNIDVSTDTFFNSVRSSGTSDPHVRYDRISQRWFVVMIDVAFPQNRMLLAVSQSATVTNATAWYFYQFSTAAGTHTSCLADYPTPGIDANAIYIGVNQFCGASLGSASYVDSDVFIVQKSSVVSGGALVGNAFPSLGMFTPQGVDNPDPAATEGYIIGQGTLGLLDLRRVTNPGSAAPTISGNIGITTALFNYALSQPHKCASCGGAIDNIDASDSRLFGATFRNGSLWTTIGSSAIVSGATCAASLSSADRDVVFWWEFQGIPTGNTPSIHQAGVICDTAATNPTYYSYGTIMVNGQGHAAMGFSIAGVLNYISGGTTGRLASDPLNTMGSITTYAAGVGDYNSFDPRFGGYQRWGDFSYTSLDPCDDMTMWTIQEYTQAVNTWGTKFAQLKAPPPAVVPGGPLATVNLGLTGFSLPITGTSPAGQGFYDTPNNLTDPCRTRLAATVTNGVVVTSITFTDPTHITLVLDTTAATAGTATITITNPDGQTVTTTITLVGPTNTPTNTATNTPTPTPTNAATNTPTFTQTNTATNTATNTLTTTNTATLTATPNSTNTPTGTATTTLTPSNTATPTATSNNTNTPTGTATTTLTPSNTATPTATSNNTNTPTGTATTTLTPSNTATPTATSNNTNTPTGTATTTLTPSDTTTGTLANTVTSTATSTGTITATFTATNTPGGFKPPVSPTPNVQVADPEISKFASPELALPGDTVTFTITVTNKGTASATNIVVTDPISDLLILKSATTSQGTAIINGSTVTFTIGTVNPGQVITLIVVTQVKGTVKPPQDVINTASINGSGKSASATVRITTGALPATGEHPADSSNSSLAKITLLIVIILGLVGVILSAHRMISARR
jgi:hypothetical protein